MAKRLGMEANIRGRLRKRRPLHCISRIRRPDLVDVGRLSAGIAAAILRAGAKGPATPKGTGTTQLAKAGPPFVGCDGPYRSNVDRVSPVHLFGWGSGRAPARVAGAGSRRHGATAPCAPAGTASANRAEARTGIAGLGRDHCSRSRNSAAAIIFSLSMNKTYYSSPMDTDESSLFRQMVGIGQQPTNVIDILRKWEFEGVVLNEWNQGGFVAFHQHPDEQTGKPPCQVYMDGRAQAAYTLEHYKNWGNFIGASDRWWFATKGPKEYRSGHLAEYAAILQTLGVTVPRETWTRPGWDAKEPFLQMLDREGITAAILSYGKPASILLRETDQWRVLADGPYVLMVNEKWFLQHMQERLRRQREGE
jgi:hypothetical protein